MKIKTDRAWELETKVNGDCLDIIEHHKFVGDSKPRIVVPLEAIDELVFQLLKLKRNAKTG